MEPFQDAELCFPQLNSSCRKITRRLIVTVIIYMILSSMSLITVTLNLLIIISISHFKQLHSPTNLLLLSLAVSDFLVGFLVCFQIMIIDGCWFLGDFMCVLSSLFDYIISTSSVGTTVLISVDRYVAICYPFYYPSKITKTGTKVAVSLCWTCSALFYSLMLKDNLQHPGRYNSCYGECVLVLDHAAAYVDLLLSFAGPITVIVLLYLRVFVVAASQARAMRSQVAATHQQSVRVTVKKSELKAARTLGVVVVVFVACVCPFFCVTFTGEDTLLNTTAMSCLLSWYHIALGGMIICYWLLFRDYHAEYSDSSSCLCLPVLEHFPWYSPVL
ncbi:trace amine-associated receptor 13c-like [Pholidichthys leucotaenia]